MPATSGTFRGTVGGGWAFRPAPEHRRAEPPARWRRDHPRRVVAAGVGLIAVFGIGLLLSGYVPFTLSLRSSMELGVGDADDFGRSRVGEVLFVTGEGNACRKVHFYNDSGRFGRDLKVRCDTGLADDETASIKRGLNSGRLMSIRDAFMRR